MPLLPRNRFLLLPGRCYGARRGRSGMAAVRRGCPQLKRQLTMGLFAGAALFLGLICGVPHGDASFRDTASPNPVQAENANRGTSWGTWLPPAVPPTNVEGYTSEASVLPGETVHFHVSTDEGEQYRIEIYRLGWYGGDGARLLACLPSCGGSEVGRRYPPPSFAGMSAGWPVTDRLAIPADWVT